MILQGLALLWLLAGAAGLWAWTRCMIRAQHRLDALKRAGKNGVLREIGLYALRTNVLGVGICIVVLLVLVNAVFIPVGETKTIIGRALVICMAVGIAVQGIWRDHNDQRIDRTIKRMTDAQLTAEAAKDGE